ncbi:phosphoadenylyl-sulfate reductase [Bacillus tianshenii]|nr:phosphoadenylyl-sulfate reductase [Bacillus tianshenii]
MNLQYHTWQAPSISFNQEDGFKGAYTVLQWAYEHYGQDIVYACSFGAEAIVLLKLIAEVNPTAHVSFLDTGLHFQQTYDTIDAVKARFPELQIHLVQPELTVAKQAEKFGDKLWERKPNQCCYYRKIKPLETELAKYSAWISGLRREQSETRQHVQFVNKDERFESIKICPLIHWTWEEVWAFIKKHDLPYNPLHDQQYPSIGCAPCTHKVHEGEDMRSGRWSNSSKTECGLHLNQPKG